MAEAIALRESLRRLEERSWEDYLQELRRLDAPEIEEIYAPDWDTEFGQFLRSDAGNPLGHGMPSGGPIAGDEVGRHIERWKLILRCDPCGFCGRRPARTVDHITPEADPNEQTFTWLNMAGACGACNRNKGTMPLLEFMRRRQGALDRRRLRGLRRRDPARAPLAA